MARLNRLFLVAAVLSGYGCGLLEPPVPETARVVIEGEAGSRVRLITATNFLAAVVPETSVTHIVVIQSDTTLATLPFQQEYAIRRDQQFFVQASRLDADLPDLHMSVFIDSDREFDETGPLRDGIFYRFVYMFNRRLTPDLEVEL